MSTTVKMVFLSAAIPLALFQAEARAVIIHSSDVTPLQDYLDYAQLFPSVGYLTGERSEGDFFAGSGVLIDPNWVLTAAHVILDADLTPRFESYGFGLSDDYWLSRGEFKAQGDVFVHPDYRRLSGGFDLALIRFDTPYRSAEPAVRTGANPSTGDDLTLVGYGLPGTHADGYIEELRGKRLAGINTVRARSFGRDTLWSQFYFPGSDLFNPLGGQGTYGDSGGGSFIERNGRFELAAISNSVSLTPGSSFPSDDTFSTKVYNHRVWIDATLAAYRIPEPAGLMTVLIAITCARVAIRYKGFAE
ncbi:S1 family peptidase [Botrimarina hoheduenensis]|uniref:Trypsin n=1 Tax=Botrimarina hoheduenensis TaxID=2528000 RepID=A0A5C5WFU5_9BACT|nr:S1 family peptidase [Botrimarina hoheduenensis]TWT48965.1 Trypsin [Botrimarina hoheduenensis]